MMKLTIEEKMLIAMLREAKRQGESIAGALTIEEKMLIAMLREAKRQGGHVPTETGHGVTETE